MRHLWSNWGGNLPTSTFSASYRRLAERRVPELDFSRSNLPIRAMVVSTDSKPVHRSEPGPGFDSRMVHVLYLRSSLGVLA